MYCPVIKVEKVSKVFRIYDRPSDRLKEVFSLRRNKYHTDYPALNEISFEVKKGEFLGIVGSNGAGKSTLLKILSRELTPTTGNVTLNGKVSLLQLGVGFDPELTGIENARFASKLLGYGDKVIENILEEIVKFADIGEFINHPVKTYSSGMYSRLSFAVGININPDILIADEVLSVGDMSFSQKCLRKMREFKEQGKTVIFVSHDLQSVNAFCDTALWIKDGISFMHGEAKEVTTHFQNYMLFDKLPGEYKKNIEDCSNSHATQVPVLRTDENIGNHTMLEIANWVDNLEGYPSVGDGRIEIKRMAFLHTSSFEKVKTVQGNEKVVLLLDILCKGQVEKPQIGWLLYNKYGALAMHSNNDICGVALEDLRSGQRIIAKFYMELPNLANGQYIFSVGLQSHTEITHKIDNIYEFSVQRNDVKGTQCGYLIIEEEKFEYNFIT